VETHMNLCEICRQEKCLAHTDIHGNQCGIDKCIFCHGGHEAKPDVKDLYEERCPECPSDKMDAFTPEWCEKHKSKPDDAKIGAEQIAREIIGKWGYEEDYWWKPIAQAITDAEKRGAARACKHPDCPIK